MKRIRVLLFAAGAAAISAVVSMSAAFAAPVLPNVHANPHAAKGQTTAAAASANGQTHAAGHGAPAAAGKPAGAGAVGAANRAIVTHWTGTFTTMAADGGEATWTCTGNRVVNKGHPAGLDSATCEVTGDTAGMVAGAFTGAPSGALPPADAFMWVSPFDGATAASWEIVLVDNGDGTFTAEASAFF